MSDYMKQPAVLLVGTGNMAREYVKVLKAQNVTFEVVGRSAGSVRRFCEETGVTARAGGIGQWLAERREDDHPQTAIVAVQGVLAADVVSQMLPCGFDRILVEKPCGMTEEEVDLISELATRTGTKVFVAYNRRFYASVLAAEKIIAEDGGVTSFCFEITERGFDPCRQDVQSTFIGNDGHVMDLAFFLGGEPEKLFAITQNNCVDFQGGDTVAFAGCGITKTGASFSYRGDWFAPGRWGVEIMTRGHRLIFRPLETLQIQNMGSFAITSVDIDDELDRTYKPGFFLETSEFLNHPDNPRLLTVQEQAEHMKVYYQMLRGNLNQ